MSRDIWDARQYQRFAGHRGRPFFDLVAAVGAEHPGSVVDLGCGPGNLTAELAERWPEATVVGVDDSADMLADAERHAVPGRLRFVEGDLREWTPPEPVDVILSNAALQWVPGHREMFPRWIGMLRPGGWFAFQVPGNSEAPSHALLREICRLPRWAAKVANVPRPDSIATPDEYLKDLVALGCAVDVWETTYLQVLQGPDPVLEWVRGTALRPVLDALDADERTPFLEVYRDRLRAAYPSGPWGTIFPFRRVFAVAHRPPHE